MRRLLRSDFVYSLTSKGYTILVGVLASAFLTRYLGLAQRGEYAFVVQISSVLVLASDLGVSQTYSYFYRQYNGSILRRFLAMFLRQFILYLLVAGVVGLLVDDPAYAYACMLVPFGVLRLRMDSAVAVERLRLFMKLHRVSITGTAIGYAFLFFARQYIGVSLLYPVLITVALNAASIFVYIRSLRVGRVSAGGTRGLTTEVVRYSWLPMLSVLLVSLNYSVDILLLRYLGSPVELSLYAVAAGIAGYVMFIPDAFKDVLASRVARSDDTGAVNLAMRLSVASVSVVILSFALVGRPLLAVLYGKGFEAAWGVALALLVGGLFMIFYKMIGVLLLAEGQRGFYFAVLASSVSINITLNLVAIPAWGMYGAAVSSLVSYSMCGGAFLIWYLKTRSIALSEAVVLSLSELTAFVRRINR